jgi:hypothetical protein
VRDVVSGEDKPQVRTRNTPAVPAAVRDLIRSAPKLAGYVNTAAGRRAHTARPRVLTLHGNHLTKPDDRGKHQGPAPSSLLAGSPGAVRGCGREAGALSPDSANRQAVVDGRGGITVDQDEICPQALLDAAPIVEAEPSCCQ